MPPSDVVEDPKKPIPEPEPTPPETPEEVLPPETPETPVESPETPAPSDPSADDLRAKLDALQAENAALKQAQPTPTPEPTKPGERVNMGQVYLKERLPQFKQDFANATDNPQKQFEAVFNTTNELVGAVIHDQITPQMQQLAMANVALANELEIRDLRSEPEFAALEPKVRDLLNKTDWKTRSGGPDQSPVADIYHRLMGAKKNGTPAAPAKTQTPPPTTRAILKDVAAGGGSSPTAKGIRLTADQEADYLDIVQNTVPGLTRLEYYTKWKNRVDQAKAAGRPVPKTYRG